ncbi:MAG: dihydropteroate synthase [Thiothrix sp.]|nr:dihydropteroate synthase [Thiothrix sp.]
MSLFLGLGSNLGDRRANLSRAIHLLEQKGLTVLRLSPVVESPALLPEGAPADWNLPYLNLVLEAQTPACTPEQLRTWIIGIQDGMGRSSKSRWAPRPMDIDILLWDQDIIRTDTLTIPHLGMLKRGFVLSPLLALEPQLRIPGQSGHTLLEWSTRLPHHIPLWMGIVNLTPDSFSDGGRFQNREALDIHLDAMTAAGVQILDLGAESTRPGATALSAPEEWARLEPVLSQIVDRYRSDPLRPRISIDTYHPAVAAQALERGADIINDVGGLTDPAMCELASGYPDHDFIAMHNLGLPASRERMLPADCDPVLVVEQWLLEQREHWERRGLNLSRLIFDPGIGFGKDGLQSQKLLQQAARFRRHGLRVLIGHSRKSFMKNFSGLDLLDKDLATIGASLNLCRQGVDILRVHNVPLHVAAYRGWTHLEGV